MHTSYCKYILGVTKRASNIAIKGEFARYPLLINCIIKAFKYLHRLLMEKSDSLLFECYCESMSLRQNGKFSWVNAVMKLIEELDLYPYWDSMIRKGVKNSDSFIKILMSTW